MKYPLGLLFGLASTLVFAQQGGIGTVKVEPNPVKAGQEVKITISAEGEAPSFCGMVVHFDDGSESRQIKIDGKDGKFPATISKTYAKAGSYSIKAEGKKITTHFPCVGSATAKLVVEGAPAAAKPAAPACPEGYKMSGKAGKAGDFSCKGGKGAVAPAQPLTCGDGLEYFSNDKSKQLGCRKAKGKK
jgi:hypothetical protein